MVHPGVRGSVCTGIGLRVPTGGLAVRPGGGGLVPRGCAAMVACRQDAVTGPRVGPPSNPFHKSHPTLRELLGITKSLAFVYDFFARAFVRSPQTRAGRGGYGTAVWAGPSRQGIEDADTS